MFCSRIVSFASQLREVFGDRTIISKVKCGTRSFTKSHLMKFGLQYNLNFNWFFRTSNSLWNENTDADKKEIELTDAGEMADV